MPPPSGPLTRGENVDEALRRLKKAERIAKEGTDRDSRLDRAIKLINRIKPWRKK